MARTIDVASPRRRSVVKRSRQDAADGAALSRCGRGDAQAIEELYDRYAGSCLTLAHSVLDDPHQAEDAVQEAFLDLWRDAAAFDPRRSSVRAWLHLLAHRKAVDRLRPEQRSETSAPLSGDDRQEEGRHPPAQGTGRLVAARTRQALAALPAADREALVLTYWGGCSQREISTLTSTPLGTVRSRMLTAMNDLRRALGEEPPADEAVSHRSGRRPVPGDIRPRLVRGPRPSRLHMR